MSTPVVAPHVVDGPIGPPLFFHVERGSIGEGLGIVEDVDLFAEPAIFNVEVIVPWVHSREYGSGGVRWTRSPETLHVGPALNRRQGGQRGAMLVDRGDLTIGSPLPEPRSASHDANDRHEEENGGHVDDRRSSGVPRRDDRSRTCIAPRYRRGLLIERIDRTRPGSRAAAFRSERRGQRRRPPP